MNAPTEIAGTGEGSNSRRFDPLEHGFVLLPQRRMPGGVKFYEWRNHARVDGVHDFHRLNGFLSQDGEFVTIWLGLLEPMFLESWFRGAGLELPEYNKELFRGHIASEEQGRHILRALGPQNWSPQVLRSDPTKGIFCEILEEKQSSP